MGIAGNKCLFTYGGLNSIIGAVQVSYTGLQGPNFRLVSRIEGVESKLGEAEDSLLNIVSSDKHMFSLHVFVTADSIQQPPQRYDY